MLAAANKKAEDLQKEGQNAYRRKQYDLAKDLFSQALQVPHTLPMLQIRILDNRAAAQEKIGGDETLRAALADAKKMIQLQKTSANGYLRAGKILQLQGSDKLAIDLYKYGLKRIAPNDDDGKKLLEGMHQKVLGRIEGPKATKCLDMMFILPLELLEMVLQKLPFHTLIFVSDEIIRLAQSVSKPWREFLSTRYPTYNTVDFSAAKRTVSQHALKACVRHSKGNITKLIVNRLNFSDGKPLTYLAVRCWQLSYVEIQGGEYACASVVEMAKVAENLKTLVLNCPTSISSIAEIINICRGLETLECMDITIANAPLWNRDRPRKLRKLLLASFKRSDIWPLHLQGLLDQIPNIRELELADFVGDRTPMDFSAFKDLTVLTLAGVTSLRRLPRLPSTIQKLDLSRNPALICTFDDISACPLPNLEYLDIGSNPKITNEHLLALLKPSLEHHRLRVLKMSMCPHLDFDPLDWLLDAGHGENLEELTVAGNSTFNDQVSKELGKLRALKRLDISHTRISGIGVLNLLSRPESAIKSVCLDGCESVGHDAVQKFKGMGISVSHKLGGDIKGGKRIRYRD